MKSGNVVSLGASSEDTMLYGMNRAHTIGEVNLLGYMLLEVRIYQKHKELLEGWHKLVKRRGIQSSLTPRIEAKLLPVINSSREQSL